MPSSEKVESSLNEIIEKSFDDAVTNTIAKLNRQVDEARAAEITVALKKDGRVMLDAITNGAKISVTIETLDRVSQIPSPTAAEIDQDQEFAERLALETKIDDALADASRPAPALLTHVKIGED